ncbi:MAG: hypothetical protein NUW01_15600 [Gemmatimonadaceae bacterium]|nr:hypothetical protein [Gemmatimonadaceae bacterium]
MTLSDAVTEYLAVLDTTGGYSTKRLANALDAVRDALRENPVAEYARPKPKKKPAKIQKTAAVEAVAWYGSSNPDSHAEEATT